MPVIRPSADLRNKYSEISDFCHKTNETVFITKNGNGDLAVMSVTEYDKLMSKLSLYASIQQGLNDVSDGNVEELDSALKEIKEKAGI